MGCVMRFEKILIMGSGKIATDCTRILCRDMGIKCLEVMESSNSQFSMLNSVCRAFGLPYSTALKSESITGVLREASLKGRLLIISANNRYLFPREICELPNVEIINFHYGYLPKYRGMNIPTWVIYNREPFTGVTWHYVTDEVDRGEIISQQKIMLNEHITAYEVVCEGMKIGVELFKTFAEELLERKITGKKILTDEFVYLSKDLPEDGKINLDKDVMEIYRLLRSFDYGRAGTLKPLRIFWNGINYRVDNYLLDDSGIEEKTVLFQENRLVVSENKKSLVVTVRKDEG